MGLIHVKLCNVYCYRRKRSFGQGNIFTSVCHSVLGVGFPACITGHMTGVFIQGVCIQEGVEQNRLGLPTEGGLGRLPPPPRDTLVTTGYGQQAGGMHPTGMPSCIHNSFSYYCRLSGHRHYADLDFTW